MRRSLLALCLLALSSPPVSAQTDSLATPVDSLATPADSLSSPSDSLTTPADSLSTPSASLVSDLIARVDVLEKGRRAAMVAADTHILGAIFADDATYAHSTGLVQTRDQLFRALESRKFRYLTFVTDEVKYRVYGQTVIGTGVQRVDLESDGKSIAVRSRYTVVYVATGTALKLVAYQATPAPGIAAPKSK